MLQAFGPWMIHLDTQGIQFESHRGVQTDGFMPQGPLPGLLS